MSAGRYAGRRHETRVVRPSARMVERRVTWAARAGAAPATPNPALTGHGGTQVGSSILQTPGGVQSELERINTDFVVFGRELEGFLKSNLPTKVSLQPLVDLFHNVWTPLLQAWQAFFERNRGWWDNFWWNHAPEAEAYADQLVEVRAHAKQLGMDVSSPTPTHFAPSPLLDPRHNVFDSLGDGAQKAMTDLWGAVKMALYAGLAIAGGYVILTLAKTAKHSEAPR